MPARHRVSIVYRSTHGILAVAVRTILIEFAGSSRLVQQDELDFALDMYNFDHEKSLQDHLKEHVNTATSVICIWTNDILDGKGGAAMELLNLEDQSKIMTIIENEVPDHHLPSFIRARIQARWALSDYTELRSALRAIWEGGLEKRISQKRKKKLPPPENRTVVILEDLSANALRKTTFAREIIEQVMYFCRVHYANIGHENIFSEEFQGQIVPSVPILICPGVYCPDDWSYSLVAALMKKPDLYRGKVVAEIGFGSGVLPLYLAEVGVLPRTYIGFDVDYLSGAICQLNFKLRRFEAASSLSAGGFLFEREEEALEEVDLSSDSPYLDLVVANVPQVPILAPNDSFDACDYYRFDQKLTGVEETLAKMGLQLVLQVLREAHTRLKTGGRVVMTIAGRVPRKQIELAFTRGGFTLDKEPIVSGLVQQDAKTDLSALQFFAKLDSALKFEFYGDQCGEQIIESFGEVIGEMQNGRPVYHNLYCFSATKK